MPYASVASFTTPMRTSWKCRASSRALSRPGYRDHDHRRRLFPAARAFHSRLAEAGNGHRPGSDEQQIMLARMERARLMAKEDRPSLDRPLLGFSSS
jgi:hypothetical protein